MNNLFYRLWLPVAALAFSSAASAASTYVCDCATGANSACVAGSDSNSGTSSVSPWQTISKATTNINSMRSGDEMLFCKGGAWPASAPLSWFSATGTATQANPMILDGYTASWGSAVRPILRFSGTALYFSSYNPIVGVTVRNLDLRGPDTVTGIYGMFIYSYTSYIVFDNLNIQGFHLGFNSSQGGAAVKSRDIVIRNSSFFNNRNGGAFIQTDNTVFENNTFTNNGSCAGDPSTCQSAALRHALYIGSGSSGTVNNIVLRGNTITQNSYQNGICEGTVITAHGIINGLLVENNLIYETTASGGGCYGIGYGDNNNYINEGMTNAIYRGNTVVNVGNNSYVFNASPGLVVENNVAIITRTATAAAFVSTNKNFANAMGTSNVTFRNNSAYYVAGSGAGSAGIVFSVSGTGTGTNNIVTNNLVYIAGGAAECWDVNGKAAADFAQWDYNLCYNLGSGGNTPPSGLNTHGLTSNPQLVAGAATSPTWSMAIQSTSPARAVTGNNAYCAVTDKTGRTRGFECDIGAYEYFGTDTVAPAAPAKVIVQ